MRKLFTTIVMAALALTASATDYTDNMRVTLDGTTIFKGETSISVDKVNGTYTLSINNFKLSDDAYVGNIVIDGVEGTEFADGTVTINADREIQITEGTEPSTGVMWLGPYLGDVPIKMYGRLKDGKFYTNITISTEGIGSVTVDFGENGYQIGNSDFEMFHEASYGDATSDEPDFWHSFMSSTGDLASMVSGVPHTFISDVEEDEDETAARPGSTGKRSLKLTSGIVSVKMGFLTVNQPANGTVTTGRLKAGAISATDPNNCSFLDLSKTDVDAIGDPFNASLTAKPDAMEVWVKFKQGTLDKKNKDYVYATVNAVITDGTYYQDPEPKNAGYTNVVAKATDNTIESNGFEWQKLTIPFDYETYKANNAEPKAILVTFSTNAQPGVGSTDANNPDVLCIDDMKLLYNSQLASLKVKGADVPAFNKDTYDYTVNATSAITADDIEAVADGRQAIVAKKVETTAEGYKATVSVTAADYSETHVYTINVAVPTGINAVEGNADDAPAAVYNVAGQRVAPAAHGINIVKQANGSVKKVMNK